MSPVAPVLPGETLAGKYRVERIVGRGGMGVVVAARHVDLEKHVAIKFLVGDCPDAAIERFLREARVAAKVRGEHVCRVFDFGRLETGEPYMVMDHLEGTDLARKVEAEGPQPIPEVVEWMIQMCDALAELHALGIVHRDLKPANIFLARRPDGSTCAKLLDFGISKLPKADAMTRTDAVIGSPAYMSPEQMDSAHGVDCRSDIWSLGVVMYELLTGHPPFLGGSIVELALKIRTSELRPVTGLRADIPSKLDAVISKCLEKNADDRYASAAELGDALGEFAPAEVAALVTRLRARLRSSISSPLALGQTEPSGSAFTREAALDRTSSPPSGGARATFAPLHSTHAAIEGTRRARASRSSIILALAAAIAMVGVVALRIAPRSSPLLSDGAVSAVASPAVDAPPPLPSSLEALPTILSASPQPSTAPVPPPPTATKRPAAPKEPMKRGTVATSTTRTEEPPPNPADIKKKRELDRDDP